MHQKVTIADNQMDTRKENRKFYCPVDVTIKLIGGKWKPILLHHLLSGEKRNGELRRLVPDITQKMLTQQLRELEEDQLIQRKVYNQVPPKVEYSLTEYGKSLEKVLHELSSWGDNHIKRHKIKIEKRHTA